MICRNCGHTVADKAIVCYRCGTPTDPAAPETRPGSSTRTPSWPSWIGAVLLFALAGVAGALLWWWPGGSEGRLPVVGTALAVVVAAAWAAWLALRR